MGENYILKASLNSITTELPQIFTNRAKSSEINTSLGNWSQNAENTGAMDVIPYEWYKTQVF